MNKFSFLLILFFSVKSSNAQIIPNSEFSLASAPKPYSDDWYKLNGAIDDFFTVSITNGDLQIEKEKSISQNQFSISNGTLLPIDKGEFGGGLYFKPDTSIKGYLMINGQQKPISDTTGDTKLRDFYSVNKKADAKIGSTLLIEAGNINVMMPYNNGWLYTNGLAHMGTNYGSLHKLTVSGNEFKTQKLFDLNGCPLSIAVHNNEIYIATFQSFYRIKNNKAELLMDNLFWEGLYPNSIAVKDEHTVFVAIRGGYVSIDVDKRTLSFYKLKQN